MSRRHGERSQRPPTDFVDDDAVVLFALAIFGIYSLAFDTTEWIQVLRVDWIRRGSVRHLVTPIGLALLGLVIMLAKPIGNRSGDDGWLWRISRALPHDLPLLVLVPVGCAALVVLGRSGLGRILVPMFVLFLIANAANATVYQYYFEPPAILFCMLAIKPTAVPTDIGLSSDSKLMQWLRYTGPIVVMIISLAYLGTARG